jgi:hypothetical protein
MAIEIQILVQPELENLSRDHEKGNLKQFVYKITNLYRHIC